MVMRLPDALQERAGRQEGLVSVRQCEAHGVSADVRARLCRRGLALPVIRGVYDLEPGRTRSLRAQRRRHALIGLLRHGPAAVAVGPSALALLGVGGLPARLQPEVAMPRGQGRVPLRRARRDAPPPPASAGVVVSVRQFDVGLDVWRVGGFRVAAPWWALAQAVPELSRGHAIAVMDALLNTGLLDTAGFARARRLARGRRGVARTHGWWELADGRAESPLETAGRLDCIDHGVAPHALQVPVGDSTGRFLGRGDLGWRLGEGQWLIAEMDGEEYHQELGALLHDRSRQNRMSLDGGVHVLRFTHRDTREPGRIAGTVRRALERWSTTDTGPEDTPRAPNTGLIGVW